MTEQMPLFASGFRLRCYIGDSKVLESCVKPKEEAKQEYKRAIAKMETAALLEEHTPEVFETLLGNIPPKAEIKIHITYVNELKADPGGKGVLVTIPTSIAPRYGQPPQGYPAASDVTEAGLNIVVHINAPDQIKKVEGRSHPVSVEMGVAGPPPKAASFADLADQHPAPDAFNPRQATARLSERNAQMDRDFVLHILTAGNRLVCSRALFSPTNSLGHAALMVSIKPAELFADTIPLEDFAGEVVFLADRSGSMSGGKIVALREALQVFLKSLPMSCRFNFSSFGDRFSSLWRRSMAYTQESVNQAVGHINEMQADMGGTELLPALEYLVTHRHVEEGSKGSTQVIALTDGEVWNSKETVGFVRKQRAQLGEQIRFFALGLGNEVSHRLIEGIGTEGGGFGEVCPVDSQGKWQERVIGMLKAALAPRSWTCEVDLGDGFSRKSLTIDECMTTASLEGAATREVDYIQAPQAIPPIHQYTRKSVYCLLELGKSPPPKQSPSEPGPRPKILQ